MRHMPALMPKKYWAGVAVLVVAVGVISGLLLSRGNSLLISSTGRAPLEFAVAPATLSTAAPARCPLAGYVAVGEFPVSVSLSPGQGITVTSVAIEVLDRRPVSLSVYLACAGKVPGSAASPGGGQSGGQQVLLPASGDSVALPGLSHGGTLHLVVRPPAGRTAGATAYRWQVIVRYDSSRYGPGTLPRGPFTLLAPPS